MMIQKLQKNMERNMIFVDECTVISRIHRNMIQIDEPSTFPLTDNDKIYS